VNVVAHIFLSDTRAYYGLEDLWGDAKTTRIS
jgi:ribosome-associated protein